MAPRGLLLSSSGEEDCFDLEDVPAEAKSLLNGRDINGDELDARAGHCSHRPHLCPPVVQCRDRQTVRPGVLAAHPAVALDRHHVLLPEIHACDISSREKRFSEGAFGWIT